MNTPQDKPESEKAVAFEPLLKRIDALRAEVESLKWARDWEAERHLNWINVAIDLEKQVKELTEALKREQELHGPLTSIDKLRAKVKELEEFHTMQLAAVMTASIQNTESTVKDRIGSDNPYWTQAYADVCVAIDREMAHRAKVEELTVKLDEAASINETRFDGIQKLLARVEELERNNCQMRVALENCLDVAPEVSEVLAATKPS
jgi:hypothetical protein